jgi:RimJ/RimL family protein N-acetyltransferase
MSGVTVVETERLHIRRLGAGDASFILELVNEPSWIRYIGDKRVRTSDDAQRYLRDGPFAMYERTGFGLYAVELKQIGEPIGICGLIKREALADVDLGFAFLSKFWHNGYAFEAAAATMSYAENVLGLRRIVAILTSDNDPSRSLLEKLGFRFETTITLDPDGQPLELHATSR